MWCKMVLQQEQGENYKLIGLYTKEESQVTGERSGKFGKSSYKLLLSPPPDTCLDFLMGSTVHLLKFTYHPASIMSIFKVIKIMPALVSNAMHQFKVQASVIRL